MVRKSGEILNTKIDMVGKPEAGRVSYLSENKLRICAAIINASLSFERLLMVVSEVSTGEGEEIRVSK